LDIFSNFSATKRIRKNRDHQKFLLMQRYLSKVKLQFSYFPFKIEAENPYKVKNSQLTTQNFLVLIKKKVQL